MPGADEAAKWQAAITKMAAPGQDIYFTPEYLALHELEADTKAKLFIFRDGAEAWIHPLLKRRIASPEDDQPTEWSDLESAYGYGGPLSSSSNADFLARAWEAFDTWCAEEKVVAEFVRLHPLVGNETWLDPKTELLVDRETVSITLEEIMAQPDKAFSADSRYMVRRAEREGVVVREVPVAEGFERFLDLYRTTMERLGAGEYYFFNDAYFTKLARLVEQHGFLLIAELKDEWVAGSLFLRGAEFLHYHLSASTPDRRIPGATNAILHQAARLGGQAGLRCLHLGGGRTPSGDDRLLRFKQSVGSGRHVFRIGKRVHNRAAYEDLCAAWEKKYPALKAPHGSRLLRYRERPPQS